MEKNELRRSSRTVGGLVMSEDALRSAMNLVMSMLLMRRYVKVDGGGGGFGVMSRWVKMGKWSEVVMQV